MHYVERIIPFSVITMEKKCTRDKIKAIHNTRCVGDNVKKDNKIIVVLENTARAALKRIQ